MSTTEPLAGADVARVTKLLSGSLYPILARFESAGWLTSEWEDVDPSEAGRPRRRLYSLTRIGQQAAGAALAEKVSTKGAPLWA